MKKKTRTIVIIVISLIVLLVGVTYAYFLWTSSNVTVALEVDNVSVTFEGGSDIAGILYPVSSRTKGISKTITVTSTNSINTYLTTTLKINSIDTGLNDSSFKWELYEINNSVETLLNSGNFASASGSDIITLKSNLVLPANSSKTIRLYLWIDGNGENPNTMQNKNFNFTLGMSATEQAP